MWGAQEKIAADLNPLNQIVVEIAIVRRQIAVYL